ncbi:hypothetical protein F5X99DRAFT_344647 [Biscogniauxia marginata]|nr:hypothetical protein F5X99DRAFT_344647 [Biscogniauxia marginata]
MLPPPPVVMPQYYHYFSGLHMQSVVWCGFHYRSYDINHHGIPILDVPSPTVRSLARPIPFRTPRPCLLLEMRFKIEVCMQICMHTHLKLAPVAGGGRASLVACGGETTCSHLGLVSPFLAPTGVHLVVVGGIANAYFIVSCNWIHDYGTIRRFEVRRRGLPPRMLPPPSRPAERSGNRRHPAGAHILFVL